MFCLACLVPITDQAIVDVFIGLNVVRAFSIIALLLVFSSSIFVMVMDVRAVNEFMAEKQSGNNTETNLMVKCDYIECVSLYNPLCIVLMTVLALRPYLINLRGFSGPW